MIPVILIHNLTLEKFLLNQRLQKYNSYSNNFPTEDYCSLPYFPKVPFYGIILQSIKRMFCTNKSLVKNCKPQVLLDDFMMKIQNLLYFNVTDTKYSNIYHKITKIRVLIDY